MSNLLRQKGQENKGGAGCAFFMWTVRPRLDLNSEWQMSQMEGVGVVEVDVEAFEEPGVASSGLKLVEGCSSS